MTESFAIDERNPLAPGWVPPTDGPTPVVFSGSLGDDLFAPHPHNWLPPGRAALDALCAHVRPELDRSRRRVVFRPHARHVLSDVPSCRAFLKDHEGEPFGIALAPADMLEPSMLERIEEHLERFVAGLAGDCACVVRADVVVQGDGCVSVPPGEGVLPFDVLDGLLAEWLPAGVGIVEPR